MEPISIVILSYNRLDEIKKNIFKILEKVKYNNEFEIIIIDNNSSDGTKEFLIELCNKFKNIILRTTDVNIGIAAGKNLGFALATREFIVAIDNDTEISIDNLRLIPDIFRDNPTIGILAFKVIHPITGELQNPHGDNPCDVANYHGSGCAFRRTLLISLIGISDVCDYGADELDFSIRVYNAGWGIKYIPDIIIYHNSLIREKSNEIWRVERWCWNHLRVFSIYFPLKMALIHSIRFMLPLFIYTIREFGIVNLFSIIKSAKNGFIAGRKGHSPVSEATIKYYSNPELRPDLGNTPFFKKLFKKFVFKK